MGLGDLNIKFQATNCEKEIQKLWQEIHNIRYTCCGISATTSDIFVKVSSDDTTAGFLSEKLIEGTGITLTENNNGGNETLSVSVDTSYTDGLYWKLLGNTGTSAFTNFVGTTDDEALVFRVNNISAGIIGIATNFANPSSVATGSGGVALGHYALDFLTTNFPTGTLHLNTAVGAGAGRWIGYTGVNEDSPGNTPSAENTLVGIWAGHYLQKRNGESNLGRNVAVGESALYRSLSGSDNVAVGNFAMEAGYKPRGNTALGRDALRGIGDGYGNVAIGGLSQAYCSTGVGSITVTDGGSGYTTATVTISSPVNWGTPGICFGTATAVATIDAGVITAITVTDTGCGYSSKGGTYPNGSTIPIGATVTITGDGVGATAVANMISNENNTSLGSSSGLYRRMGTGNLDLGYNAGSVLRWYDDYTIMIGTGSAVDSSITADTKIEKAVAIGYNAKVATSNSMVLGGTGADALNVGIGLIDPQAPLHVVGSKAIIDYIDIYSKGTYTGAIPFTDGIGVNAVTNDESHTAIGYRASLNQNGVFCTSVGIRSQEVPSATANQTHNTSVGAYSLRNITQFGNTAIGSCAMYATTSHYRCTAVGAFAMTRINAVGTNGVNARGITAIGYLAVGGTANCGEWNTAVGHEAGYAFNGSSANTAIGAMSMGSGSGILGGVANLTGTENTGIGSASLFATTTGSRNTAIGSGAGRNCTTNLQSVFIGYGAGQSIVTGDYNVVIGGNAGAALNGLNNRILLADGQGNERISVDDTGVVYIQTVNNDDTEDKLLTWNSTTKNIEYRSAGSIGGSFALTDGSGTTVGGDTTSVDLGGTLTSDASIILDGFDFNIKTGTYVNFSVDYNEIYGSIDVGVAGQYTEFVQDKNSILLSTQDSGHHGDVYVESGGIKAMALISASDWATYYSRVEVDETGAYMRATSTGNSANLVGIKVAQSGEVSFDVVNNDDTETKLLTWNSTSKNIEYRNASSLTDTNFANTDLTLTGDRVHDGDGFDFSFTNTDELIFGSINSIQLGTDGDILMTANSGTSSFNIFTGGQIAATAPNNFTIVSPYTLLDGELRVGIAGTSSGIIKVSGSTSGTITISPANAAGTYSLVWPTAQASGAQYLKNDGSGNLSWDTPVGGGGYTVHTIDDTDSPYTISETSGTIVILIDATNGDVDVNLPTAVGNTAEYRFKRINSSANTVTIDADGTEEIDGDLTKEIVFENTSFTIINDNANWWRTS